MQCVLWILFPSSELSCRAGHWDDSRRVSLPPQARLSAAHCSCASVFRQRTDTANANLHLYELISPFPGGEGQ